MLTPQGFTTRIIHNPYAKEDINRALIQPIYSNATFDFESAEQMELAFLGRIPAHSYSRISNPTVENLELRIKEITGSLNVTALSSGMAAITNTIFLLASAGSNIIISRYLFGNTYSLINSTMKEYGIESRICDLKDPSEVRKSIDTDTIAVFAETITNPQLEVVDLLELSAVAHEMNVPVIVDSTLTPPNVFRPRELGVDLEVISSTKCFSGGATSTGGLIVDYGSFDWGKSFKLAPLAKRFGPMAFNYKLRREIFRNLGSCMSPFAAYFQSLGLETLQLRFEKSASNCIELVKLLTSLPRVKSVNYPGIEGSEFYEVSRRQFGAFPGAMLTFDLESKEACFTFLNRLNIIKRATNIYDNKTLIIHPASTIYCDFDAAERMTLRVRDNTLRLSAGIEDTEDLKNDILQALNI